MPKMTLQFIGVAFYFNFKNTFCYAKNTTHTHSVLGMNVKLDIFYDT